MGKYQLESKMFQALAHPVRLQILEALARRPSCVCELVMLTGRRQAYISQHLVLLRGAGLVDYKRDGRNIFYQVNAARLEDAVQVLRPFFQLANDDLVTTMYQGDNK